jgi:hypothetical protein
MSSVFRTALFVAFMGGMLLLGSCAHVDVPQAAQVCATDAVKKTAKEAVPAVLEAIKCETTTDAGTEQCAKNALESIIGVAGPEVFGCALALIHDQTIP